MYDAIVIGARCAGSPAAMLLARKGYRVLLLDRGGFPSDTLSTHYVHLPGVARLKRWGLLDRLVASNCPPIREMTLDVGPFALVGEPVPVDGIRDAYAPRRKILDQILVEAAVESGAELREHFTVKELVWDGDRVIGIRGHAEGGAVVTEQARVVIGADGMRSFVARSVQAPSYNTQPALTCAFYTYWNDVPVERSELYARPDRMIVSAPTHHGQSFTIVLWHNADFHEVHTDIEKHFMDTLELAPELAERVRGGTRAEPFRGTADLPNFFRRPYGAGWALVGDAGYHRDPITAQGISDAFRDAELLADAIDDGFTGRRPLEDALADYERLRNEAVMPIYELTCQMAALEAPTPDMQQLFTALQRNPEQLSRFFGAVVGTVPIAEFYAPENIGRILEPVG